MRDKISFTPQKAILFQGTIKSNMLLGKENASDSEIENALQLAQVDFIDSLNDKVSQEASNFSGGQKQRLSIARAIIGKHSFYLFDDCFSVKNNLYTLSNDSSILIVSQRISTIKDADEILVINNGEIVDRGTHDELNKTCEIYHEIVTSQIDSMGVNL